MLNLTRRSGQKVIIHHPETMEIYGEIMVHRVNGKPDSGAVALGFKFQPEVAVNREEIYLAMVREKELFMTPNTVAEEEPKAVKYYDGATIKTVPTVAVKVEHKISKLNANRGC